MSAYYKYAEREAASVIDWSKISQSLVNTLKDESDRREKLKAEIDERSFKFGEDLNNVPQGEYVNQNTWILDAADKGQQTRLMQDRLLKSGDLSLNQYLTMRRNTESSFKELFAVSKEYQEEYKSKMDRYRENKSSKAEGDLMKTIESLANFTNTDAYINPTSGVMNLSRKELVDGVYKPTGGYVSVQALRNRLKVNVDKVQTEEFTADVNTLGETVISNIRRVDGMNRLLEVEKTKDPTIRKALEDDPEIGTYVSWENSKVDEYLANPYKTLSILTDYVGKNAKGETFELTFDEEAFNNDKSGRLYLMKDDGSGVLQPTFKKEQQEMVGKHIRNEYRNMIDREKTISVEAEPERSRPSVAEMEYADAKGQAKKDDETMATMLGYLYYGDNRQVDAASTYYRGLNSKINSVKRDGNEVRITYIDGTSVGIPLKDANGNVLSQEDFIKQATELHGQKDVSRLLKTQAYDPTKRYNPFSKGGASVTAAPVDNTMRYQNILKTKGYTWDDLLPDDLEDNPGGIARNLTKAFQGLGFTFGSITEGMSDDFVTVNYNGQNIGRVNVDEPGNWIAEFDSIMKPYLKEAPKDDDDKNKQGNDKRGKLDDPGG